MKETNFFFNITIIILKWQKFSKEGEVIWSVRFLSDLLSFGINVKHKTVSLHICLKFIVSLLILKPYSVLQRTPCQ